jgi:NTE family protein
MMSGGNSPRVGLVLGAGGILGGAWLTGALHAIASETGWDPGSADYIVGTSAGSMIGALVACGVPPWFMVAHSAGESFDGLADARGEAAAGADRSAGAVFRLDRTGLALGPGSWRLALASLARPYR